MRNVIVSLFDFSGEWSKPYREAGYVVLQYDLKLGHDVLNLNADHVNADAALAVGSWDFVIQGVLAAPPCTHFASSGARWMAAKDADGTTREALALLDHTLHLIDDLDPKWWALENPVGRLPKLRPRTLGAAAMFFQPHHFGDPYTKKTGLWGTFSTDLQRTDVEPVMYTSASGKRGSYMWAKAGGKSERTKALRSVTPAGFARAFFNANP